MPNDLFFVNISLSINVRQPANSYHPITIHINLPYNMAAINKVEFSDVTTLYVYNILLGV